PPPLAGTWSPVLPFGDDGVATGGAASEREGALGEVGLAGVTVSVSEGSAEGVCARAVMTPNISANAPSREDERNIRAIVIGPAAISTLPFDLLHVTRPPLSRCKC